MEINYWNCIVFDGQNVNILKETAGILSTLNYNKKENRGNVNCISFCLDYKIAIQTYLSTMNLYTSYTHHAHIIYTYTHHTHIIHIIHTSYTLCKRIKISWWKNQALVFISFSLLFYHVLFWAFHLPKWMTECSTNVRM